MIVIMCVYMKFWGTSEHNRAIPVLRTVSCNESTQIRHIKIIHKSWRSVGRREEYYTVSHV